jgi:ADP-ribose pyrophosphatase YjhB (NUDIX family)
MIDTNSKVRPFCECLEELKEAVERELEEESTALQILDDMYSYYEVTE